MVVQLLAKAAISAAKKSIKKAPRAKKKGDTLYNTRRNYTRAAERAVKEADNLSGSARDFKLRLAEEYMKKALNTYQKGTKKLSKPLQNLVNRLNNQDEEYGQMANLRSYSDDELKTLFRQSRKVHNSNRNIREEEARIILSSKIGNSIYGGLVQVWQGQVDINAALMEYLGVSDRMGIIEKINEKVDLFKKYTNEEERYDMLRQLIEKYYTQNE